MESPFNVISDDPWDLMERIRGQAGEVCPPGCCPLEPMLDDCIHQAIEEIWDSRIRAFVPLLVLRQVMSCIESGSCAIEGFQRK